MAIIDLSNVYVLDSSGADVDKTSAIPFSDPGLTSEEMERARTNIGASSQTEYNVLKSRMDEFASLTEGSTTGDAELQDIRVDYEGATWPTAGDAVRGQVSEVIGDFNSISEYSRNLFDKSTCVRQHNYLNSSGKYAANANGGCVIFPCKPSTTYTISKISSTWLRVARAASTPVEGTTYPFVNPSDQAVTTATITTGETDHFLIIYCYNASNDSTKSWQDIIDSLQIEEGSIKTDYVPYYKTAKDVTIRNEFDDFTNEYVKENNNLFNKDSYSSGAVSISGSTGKISGNADALTVIIPCEGSTTYTISKIKSARLVFGYSNSDTPVAGDYLDGFTSGTNDNSVATITTGASAKLLLAFVYLVTADTTITEQEIIDSIQIEVGSEPTLYVPYGDSVVDSAARAMANDVNEKVDAGSFVSISTKHISAQNEQNTAYGSELLGALSGFTSENGATYDSINGKWHLEYGQSIKTSVAVTQGHAYHIITQWSDNPVEWRLNQPNTFTVKLGTDVAGFFYASDKNPNVDITASNTGTVVLELVMGEYAAGDVFNVSMKDITEYTQSIGMLNSYDVHSNNDNMAVGGGHKAISNGDRNTAFGYEAQNDLNTGKGNTAFGYRAQKSIKGGSYNTAFGQNSQLSITEGMYNCAFGHIAQPAVTKGCWNVAMGIESQGNMDEGCNNTSIGRRVHFRLTKGNGNTAVGAQAGFVNDLDDTTYRTTTANYQTTVGFNATQAKSATFEQRDYATSFGAFAKAGENATALGPKSSATGAGSVAIGCDNQGNGASASSSNQIAIGTALHSIVLAGHKINFNEDGTVTWEALE